MQKKVRAPSLDAGLGWLNTDRPLRLHEELAGQVVVLDFWTYCCINCIHILPDLAFLEHRYEDQPVVFIGVHSAKFTNEAHLQTIRAAIHRYEIAHPVVMDDDMRLWRSYAVRSWPTVVIIDPKGYVVMALAGEGQREAMDRAIGDLLAEHRALGSLSEKKVAIKCEGNVRAASGLAFPGKVLADLAGKRLFISDSNHNRIVVSSWPDEVGRAELIKVIGGGAAGAVDGSAENAQFNHPQGLALGRDKLYVADTENHTLRMVNLRDWNVATAVGTGRMTYDWSGGGKGTQQGINSPWDIAIEGSTLYVAMAGQHQIWRIDMPAGFARAMAGSGRENIVDGPNETSALAQPSGICMHNGMIYFVDSEVSAVRMVDMGSERVSTLIGEGLFHFGDADGPFEDALLQHPLGVATWRDKLLIADTYNHKIKEIDLHARTVATRYGNGTIGTAQPGGSVQFFEPGGLAVADDRLFVADTNNHRVIMIELLTGLWSELVVHGLEPPVGKQPAAQLEQVGVIHVDLSHGGELVFDLELPPGAELSDTAPWSIRIEHEQAVILQTIGRSKELPLRVSLASQIPLGTWRVHLNYAYCTHGEAQLCVPESHAWEVTVTHRDMASSQVHLRRGI